MNERWQEIERIYHAARELDKSARAEFLAKACAADADLRREVESLLAHRDQAGSFLESPAIEVAAAALAKEKGLSGTLKPAPQLGAMIAHYRLAGKIGEGGMGEVYRALDTKLQRDVALKILPETMAHDAHRMARFEREAQVLASLNHPNIAAIHGLEESNGIHALVMELVEGEMLGKRIGRDAPSGRLKSGSGTDTVQRETPQRGVSTDDALPIARQIAEALEYAHERGVIHRDLKPANVKITPEGTVKVLDFGLAKVLNPQDSPTAHDSADSSTLSTTATQPGVIMGTAAYMSPEQAKGERVDRRCDIWAFGCVLYEMLSGRQAFEGETISDVLVAVLTKEPDWTALPATTPLSIQRLIRRCLQKDQRQRLQAIGDARIVIEETLSGTGIPPVVEQGQDAHARPLRRALPWALAGILAAVFLAVLGAHLWLQPEAEKSAIRFTVSAPDKHMFSPLGGFVRVSPDGGKLAFASIGMDGKQQLWVRPIDGLEAARSLAGTEGAEWPFWSPDSRQLGFYANGKLKKVDASGGPVQTLCDASAGGGTWNHDGVIVFTNHHVLYGIPEAGGNPAVVLQPDAASRELVYFPQFLPDGRHFIFSAVGADLQNGATRVGSLDSTEQKTLLSGDSTALYAHPGYLLYLQEGVLMARRFDARRLDFTADPVSIAEDVGSNTLYPYSYFSVSANGVLAYQSRATTPAKHMIWFSRRGEKLGSVGDPGVYSNPAISPDGARVAVGFLDSRTSKRDIWVYDLKRGTGSPLTFDPAGILDPAWSPDGKQVMFTSEHHGVRGIYRKLSDGLGNTELVYAHKVEVREILDWSTDGRYAMYDDTSPKARLIALPLFGQRKAFAYVEGGFNAVGAQFSPNGQFVAYDSDETGRSEVYVQTFPEHTGKWQVSTSGGTEPMWRRDGNELFYLKPDDTVMSVGVKTSASEFHAGIPKPLFKTQLVASGRRNRYAVSPDGERFLMIVPAGEARPRPITVVLNWPALLKKQ